MSRGLERHSPAVSYTHLDVYKRQDKMDKLLNLDNYGVHSVLVVTLGYDAEDDHNRTCLLYTSRCV